MLVAVPHMLRDEEDPQGLVEVTAFFDGLTVVDPGVVLTHQWSPDSAAEAATPGVLRADAARAGEPCTMTETTATRGFLRDSGAMTR